MFNQHAKWLKTTRQIPWRRPIASLNYLLSSHVWRQDHNGFSHQGPRLHRSRHPTKKGRGCPPYTCRLMPTLCCPSPITVYGAGITSNVIVAGKQPRVAVSGHGWPLSKHCTTGAPLGMWEWASNDQGGRARFGDGMLLVDVPTLETLAAVDIPPATFSGTENQSCQTWSI